MPVTEHMSPLTITRLIALLTIVGQAGLVLVILGWPWRKTALRAVYDFLSNQALFGAFLVVAGGVLGSLYFSEVAKFPPCELCWFQRILMYPQLLLIGLALAKKNRDVVLQTLILSGLRAAIALYQVYLQFGGLAMVPCSTTGLAASCSQKNFLEFGYITIPIMALTGFVMIIVAMMLHRRAAPTVETE